MTNLRMTLSGLRKDFDVEARIKILEKLIALDLKESR